jgi:hypothetical protein
MRSSDAIVNEMEFRMQKRLEILSPYRHAMKGFCLRRLKSLPNRCQKLPKIPAVRRAVHVGVEVGLLGRVQRQRPQTSLALRTRHAGAPIQRRSSACRWGQSRSFRPGDQASRWLSLDVAEWGIAS